MPARSATVKSENCIDFYVSTPSSLVVVAAAGSFWPWGAWLGSIRQVTPSSIAAHFPKLWLPRLWLLEWNDRVSYVQKTASRWPACVD